MEEKITTSRELQDIFDLERDDIRRLEKAGVLHPKANGKGVASEYGLNDISRLLDVKMYLLGGFRISDMEQIFTEDYDPSEMITEQIKTYKKRIQILEFINSIRSDLSNLYELSFNQVKEFNEKAVIKDSMPQFGTNKYWDIMLSYLKLIFIMDFLSQKESYYCEDMKVLKKVWDAYEIIRDSWSYFSVDDLSEYDITQDIIGIYEENVDEDTIREFAEEIVNEYNKNSQKIKETIKNEYIDNAIEEVDEKTKECFGNLMSHFYGFTLTYFMDEDSIFYILVNLQKFIKALDKDELLKGNIRRK